MTAAEQLIESAIELEREISNRQRLQLATGYVPAGAVNAAQAAVNAAEKRLCDAVVQFQMRGEK